MKKLSYSAAFSFILLTSVLFVSCGPSDEEIIAVQEAEDALRIRDSIENEMVETMDEINRNLDVIREKQGLISLNSNPEDFSQKSEILRNISIINDLIDANRRRIDELTMQAKKLGQERNAFARIADQTRQRMLKQEEEIAQLKSQLEQESFKVSDLNRRLDEAKSDNEALQAETQLLLKGNAELDKNMNKAYFTYGTSKQLEEKQIVEKKGGLFGLGGKDALSAAFYRNKASFTELDIRETRMIPVHGRKPKILSAHPEGSYEWKKSGEDSEYSQLHITAPEEFWITSRFLVVEIQ